MSRSLEEHFSKFRKNITGIDQFFDGPQGRKKILYADWTASGRLYTPIETRMSEDIGKFVANTHTETSLTGKMMTNAYHEAKHIIKHHVNAKDSDVFIPAGTGMTGAVLKLQRILGLKMPEKLQPFVSLPDEERPVVFITHMEHHSNQTSWLETIAKVELIGATADGLIDLEDLDRLLEKHKTCKKLIASVTGCSNVTGIETPYHEIARKMHRAGGLCFVDFACSGPYVKIDMHPENDPEARLDSIFFSPHKFLGGPGTTGVLIFDSELYNNKVPDCPGGGTVTYTNPWGVHFYIDDIEAREDGGTPGFLQTIKAALCVKLKEEMGIVNIRNREHQIVEKIFSVFDKIPNLEIMAGNVKNRLGVIAFNINGLHYNLGVKLLNDYFGIQTRGGCACAGTYGHLLLNLDEVKSYEVWDLIKDGNQTFRPGWIRMSIHPTMTDLEVSLLCEATKALAENWQTWGKDYVYDTHTNEFNHKTFKGNEIEIVEHWFTKPLSN